MCPDSGTLTDAPNCILPTRPVVSYNQNFCCLKLHGSSARTPRLSTHRALEPRRSFISSFLAVYKCFPMRLYTALT